MANSQKIDELIDPAALKQWSELISILEKSKIGMAENIDLAIKLNNALGKTTTMNSFVAEQEKASVAIQKVSKSNEQTRLSEIRLQQAREKNIDKYNKDLAKKEAAEKKAVDRTAEMSRAYNVLSTRLDVARKNAKDIGVTFGLNSRQFKAASNEVIKMDTEIKKLDSALGQNQRNVGNYNAAVSGLERQLNNIGISLTRIANSPDPFKELGRSIIAFGKQAIMFMLTPLGLLITTLGALFALISGNKQTVIDFDNGLKSVSKTTNIAGKDLTDFGDAIVELSRKLKITSTDKLLEYATVAGQLGVRGTQNILNFSEALAKLETATDITGQEGGTNIARLLTLVDGGVQNVAKFGDEIVNLGNNFAATENEILTNATAIAQNVGLYKIGRQDVLAYATATKALGIEAEVTGSSFNRTLALFERSLRTGKDITTLARVIGDSAENIKSRFKEDAAGVFNDFIKGLNGVHNAGESVNGILTEIGINQVRDQRVIASLATNGYDVLTAALETAGNAAGSMDQEFETAASKISEQSKRIGIAWDNIVLSIENGEGALGNAAKATIEVLADTLDQINKIVTSTGWNEFFARLTDFKLADRIRDMNTAFGEGESTLKKLSTATKFTQEGYDELEASLAKAVKEQKNYKAAIDAGEVSQSKFFGSQRSLKDVDKIVNDLAGRMFQYKLSLDATKKANEENAIVQEKVIELTEEEIKARDKAAAKAEKLRLKKEAEAKKALDLENKRIASEIALEEYRYKTMANIGKEISDNDKLTYGERIVGLSEWMKYSKEELEAEKNKNLQLAKLPAERLLIEEQYYEKLRLLQVQAGVSSEAILKDNIAKEDQARLQAYSKKETDLINNQTKELDLLNSSLANGSISLEEYNKEKIAIQQKYSDISIQNEISEVQKLIEIQKLRGVDVGQQEKQLAELKMRYSKEAMDAQISDLETLEDKEQELFDKKVELGRELFNVATTLFNAGYERDKQRVELEIENLDKRTEKEKNAVNQLVLTQEEKTIRLAQIDARAALQREQLEARQRGIQVREARFKKASDILGIIGNTALAVTKALPNIPLSIVIGAIGAAQIAQVIATPLPKFWTGTDSSPEGFAHVGEKGSELMIDKSGNIGLSPSTDTVTYLQKGTQIIDAERTKAIFANASVSDALGYASVTQSIDISKIVNSNKETAERIEKAIKSRPEKNTILTKSGLRYTYSNGKKWNDYRNRNLN